jgi:hypothetical protein
MLSKFTKYWDISRGIVVVLVLLLTAASYCGAAGFAPTLDIKGPSPQGDSLARHQKLQDGKKALDKVNKYQEKQAKRAAKQAKKAEKAKKKSEKSKKKAEKSKKKAEKRAKKDKKREPSKRDRKRAAKHLIEETV